MGVKIALCDGPGKRITNAAAPSGIRDHHNTSGGRPHVIGVIPLSAMDATPGFEPLFLGHVRAFLGAECKEARKKQNTKVVEIEAVKGWPPLNSASMDRLPVLNDSVCQHGHAELHNSNARPGL